MGFGKFCADHQLTAREILKILIEDRDYEAQHMGYDEIQIVHFQFINLHRLSLLQVLI